MEGKPLSVDNWKLAGRRGGSNGARMWTRMTCSSTWVCCLEHIADMYATISREGDTANIYAEMCHTAGTGLDTTRTECAAAWTTHVPR